MIVAYVIGSLILFNLVLFLVLLGLSAWRSWHDDEELFVADEPEHYTTNLYRKIEKGQD